MRSFDNAQGEHWQAALMEASFGNTLLVFSRIGGDGVRVQPLETANYSESEHWLAATEAAELCRLLDGAKPFP